MAINFDTLPQENPFALPTPGLYKATIDDLNSVEYLLAFIIKKPILDYLGLCPRNKAIRIFSIRALLTSRE